MANLNSSAAPFQPHPLLAGGHRQTLAACYLASGHHISGTQQHRLQLPDGDTLVLHEDCPANWNSSSGAALLVHGLCGCHRSRYLERITSKLLREGVRVFRLDLRGCGAGEGLARSGTHCGSSGDLETPVQFIGEVASDAPLTVVGFSLGASLSLDLAATSPTPEHWVSTVAVCPPIDLFAVEQLLQKPLNRLYDRFFARRLWKQVRHRARTIEGAPSVTNFTRPRLLRDFDENFTAPLGGYQNADDYYRQSSVVSRLQQIAMPTRIIAAADDPVVPIEPIRAAQYGPKTEVIEAAGGGHLGFIGKRGSDPDHYWLDWRIVEWVLQQHNQTECPKETSLQEQAPA